MIRYALTIPGSHPAAETLFNQEVYVEALPPGPQVGFAMVEEQLWIDMPAPHVETVPAEELLNPEYHYVGRLLPDRLVLTDVLTGKGPLDHEAKFVEADRIGLECVQLLHAGALEGPEQIMAFIQQSPAGVVIKPIKVNPQRRLTYVELTPDMFGPANDTQEESCQTSSSVN